MYFNAAASRYGLLQTYIYIYIYTTKYIYAESVSDMVLVYHIALGAGVGNEGAGVIR